MSAMASAGRNTSSSMVIGGVSFVCFRSRAITDAVKQCEFTAVRVDGEAMPARMIVTITVDWR